MSENEKACCAPRRNGLELTPNLDLCTQAAKNLVGSKDGMIQVEAGKYSIGFEGPEACESDGEGPVPARIDPCNGTAVEADAQPASAVP